MRITKKYLAVSVLALGLFAVSVASALQLKVVSLTPDGKFIWTADQTNVYCGVQYTSALDQPWTPAPPPYWNIFSTTHTNSVVLPLSPGAIRQPRLFFRVVASTNVLPGLQIYDLNSNGIPLLVESNYIELDKISSISRFRSGEGHDYSDDFEHCRNMKHYFTINPTVAASSVKIFSPVNGYIYGEQPEDLANSGTQVRIATTNYPGFLFILFHVNVTNNFGVGDPDLTPKKWT